MSSIILFLSLPVTESIGENDIARLNRRVGIALDEFIPRIGSSDGNRVGSELFKEGSDIVDLVRQPRSSEFLSVKSLRADSHGIDMINSENRYKSAEQLLVE